MHKYFILIVFSLIILLLFNFYYIRLTNLFNLYDIPDFKRKIYETEIKGNVFCAYDDDQRVIDVWVELGITSFKVFVIDEFDRPLY